MSRQNLPPNFNPFDSIKKWEKSCAWLSGRRSLKHIDFFCGAGGLSIGFERSGFLTVLATDWDAASIETFQFNRPNQPLVALKADIATLFKKGCPKHLLGVDVVTGGPPCQSFSTANRQRVIDDPRNNLYKEFVRCCAVIKPKAILMENVLGIRKVSDQILVDFENIGYRGVVLTLNAADFGIPQKRRRVFFVLLKANSAKAIKVKLTNFCQVLERAQRDRASFVLADAIAGLRHLKPRSVKNRSGIEDDISGRTVDVPIGKSNREYLKTINGTEHVGGYIFNHKARYNNPRDIKIFGILPQGADSLHSSISNIMPYKRRNGIFKDKYFKLVASEPCKTVCAHMKFDCNMYIHPTQPRGLTPRESARIQTFPDNYVFKGTLGQWYQQIGNAVPPLLAHHIANALKVVLQSK